MTFPVGRSADKVEFYYTAALNIHYTALYLLQLLQTMTTRDCSLLDLKLWTCTECARIKWKAEISLRPRMFEYIYILTWSRMLPIAFTANYCRSVAAQIAICSINIDCIDIIIYIIQSCRLWTTEHFSLPILFRKIFLWRVNNNMLHCSYTWNLWPKIIVNYMIFRLHINI